MKSYDVIVVGGGHAGVEASHAPAILGLKTLLITLDKHNIANMPCNPSIGGSAKGIVVREIDALGGIMGINADKGVIQLKMLNTSKGPGVQCLRAQIDKKEYPKIVLECLEHTPNLDILEDEVKSLIYEGNKVIGVRTSKEEIGAKAVILTTGTYMESVILRGHDVKEEGPDGQKPSKGLSPYLESMGLKLIRLKTGTPQRIKKSSIDFSVLEPQYGDNKELKFSFTKSQSTPFENQILCYLTYTNSKTHQIINDHLLESAMYGGVVTGVGPRYCPSIEDKIVRFKDKERHQLFLEPETRDGESIYLQGFSTSMPESVQLEMVHSLKGLEHAEILKYAYAIEYDAIDTNEYDYTLETRKYSGLFIAGQICGTSGYEEAAGLGLIAGINASNKILGRDPLILRRDQSYIGVMIDDLVSKGTKEPYRLLSSRAEYRLLLRSDNADKRLTPIAYNFGLIDEDRYNQFLTKYQRIEDYKLVLDKLHLGNDEGISSYLKSLGFDNYKGGPTASEIIKRPEVKLVDFIKYLPEQDLSEEELEELEIQIKYEGYIAKAKKDAERLEKLENVKIPQDISYSSLSGLRLEARQKLDKVRPTTISQASRISGVNPSDIAMLLIHLKKGDYHD